MTRTARRMSRMLGAMLLVLALIACDSLMESLQPNPPAGDDDNPGAEHLPDLYLPWASAEPSGPAGGDDVVELTYRFILANRGHKDAPETTIDILTEFHPYDPRDESRLDSYERRVQALPPGGTVILRGVAWSAFPGDLILTVTIDPEGTLQQSDRLNDTATWTFTIPHLCAEPAAPVDFQDDALMFAILDQLEGHHTAVSCHELSRLTDLSVEGRGITSLEGIQGAASLYNLNASGNRISDLEPVKDLTRLFSLRVSNNQLTDLDELAGLTGLYTLDAGYNPLQGLGAVSGMTSLRHLYVPSIGLQDLSALYTLTELESLDLHQNLISDLAPLTGMTNLHFLNLQSNQLTDLTHLPAMAPEATLYLWDNRISDLAPLVANESFTAGSAIYLESNCLDLTPGSLALQQIAQLQERGVQVGYEWQNDCAGDQ